jgi:hypothetical protein
MDHRIEPTRARQDLTEMANGPADDLICLEAQQKLMEEWA